MEYFILSNKKIYQKHEYQFRNKYIYCVRSDKLDYWDSFKDKKNKISLFVLGRHILEEKEWHLFDNKSAFISRYLIQKYIDLDINQFSIMLNGALNLIIVDEGKNQIIIITDKLGIYPLYVYEKKNTKKFCISSHSDILADLISYKTIDEVSVAEFLCKGFINFPNTYYKEIKILNSGSYHIWDFNKNKQITKEYFYFNFSINNNSKYLIDLLTNSLYNAISKRSISFYGNKALFISGGSDSRVIATLCKNNITGISLFNIENQELKIIKQITSILNIPLILIEREFDYYLNTLRRSILSSGGNSSIISDHFINLIGNPKIENFETFLSGCYIDYMFKAFTVNKQKLQLLSVKLPINRLGEKKEPFIVGFVNISKKFSKLIEQRDEVWFKNSENIHELERKSIFPLGNTFDSNMRITLLRFFGWSPIFVDNELIKLYLQIPIKKKLNSEIYNRAVSILTKEINFIPHANHGIKIGINPYIGLFLKFLRNIRKKILKKDAMNPIFGDGSWINPDKYAQQSKKVFDEWYSINPFERDIINEILEINLWQKDYNKIIQNNPYLFFRIITFSNWHKYYRERKLSINQILKLN